VEEKLVKKLVASVKCSVCGQRYKASNIDVLGHEEDLWFLRISCPVCNTQYLVAAIIEEDRMPELVTDLTEAELDRFRNMDKLTPDDVLDMYNFLQDFDGDFARLFSQS